MGRGGVVAPSWEWKQEREDRWTGSMPDDDSVLGIIIRDPLAYSDRFPYNAALHTLDYRGGRCVAQNACKTLATAKAFLTRLYRHEGF